MDSWNFLFTAARDWGPVLIAILASALVIAGVRALLRRRAEHRAHHNHALHQLLLVALAVAGIILVILELPIDDTARGQLLSLFGIVVTAAIALSSTTFVGNAMAGLMLRVVKSFKPGDFLRVREQMGRVTVLGLLHTEIQTEDRDLTTLPNLFLVTNPVKVVRSSGTIVSAKVSLGYEHSHRKVEELLLQAATAAELEEPFVQIVELGDHSVEYRVSGFLRSPRFLISARSKLRTHMLDALHEGDIEIVSPQFINQRRLGESRMFIPHHEEVRARDMLEQLPEDLIFDKADRAEKRQRLQEALERAQAGIALLEEELDSALAIEREQLEAKKASLEARRQGLVRSLEALDQDGPGG